ncbi:E3 SUMO-protein ligase ZBED1 [Frankliniella fusca]|uniref:E3 SUMO-protein ligase ZBED1 n=1 Tax=Frankliniella fusca TaxID=407009 RepID=A0AAE1H7R0_9NEOP|nr:E3 SUMO-protein ligase ZBED1 [Frankliniella fusca]
MQSSAQDEDDPSADVDSRETVSGATTSSSSLGSSRSLGVGASGEGDGPSPPKRQRTATAGMTKFVDTMTPEEKEQIDESLARAVYAKGLPLSVFEGGHFQKAFNRLRPAYVKPPSRYKLSGPLLDKEYAKIEAINKEKFQSSKCKAVMLDGCANTRTEHVINFIVCTPEPIFYNYKIVGDSVENHEFIATEIKKVLRDVNEKNVFLLVTDNAAVMKAAWEVIETEFPHITAVGCAAHCLNLLFKDLVAIPKLSKLILVANSIVKAIKKSYRNLAVFREKQKAKYGNLSISLKLASKTRWAGSAITLNSLMRNKAAIQETVVNDDLTFKETVRQWALDNTKFWERVKIALDMLKPLHACVTLIESNKALLSDVFYLTKKYSTAVTTNLRNLRFKRTDRQNVKRILRERESFTVKPIHKASFLLDPRYREQENMLSDDDVIEAIDFITKMSEHLELNEGAVTANLAELRTKTGFFGRESVWSAAERMAPNIWWDGICSRQPLAPIAGRLLSLPPSAAESERNWKLLKYIHSKPRNRLQNERVKKLVALKAGLNGESKGPVNKPFFTVAEIDTFFESYLPGESTLVRADGQGEEEVDSEAEEDDPDDDELESDGSLSDLEAGSDWSEGDELSGDEDEEPPSPPRRRQQSPPGPPPRRSTRCRR